MSTAVKAPVFRQVKTVNLEYGEEVTVDLPKNVKFLGAHAQYEVPMPRAGNRAPRPVRAQKPQLVYLYVGGKEQVPMTFLLLGGQAELPLDDRTYTFIDMVYDRDPTKNSFATVWLVTERKKS